MANKTAERQEVVSCRDAKTQNWSAWLNTMPPKPDDFHVTGHVEVGNPGIEAFLSKKVPQGFNPAVLLLDLYLIQKPGVWPEVICLAQVRYDEVPPGFKKYTDVTVLCENNIIAQIPVETVS